MALLETQDTSPFEPSSRPLSTVGRAGKPIRALSFSGGGFDTAMQLGVVHALLVTGARPPDVVVGASAGAVSAVALAEVLQAGDMDDPGPKVARFRELFEAYRSAPGEIIQSLEPDPAQVDTQRPLETLKLPIHHRRERRDRTRAVGARAGLINLYNTLLSVRLSVGTIARAVRCWLGIRASKEIRTRPGRWAARVGEGFRAWLLVGANLHRVATLVPPIIRAAFPWGKRTDEGATAAELIFAASIWRDVWRQGWETFWTVVLIVLWLGFSAVLVSVVTGLGTLLLRVPGISSSLLAGVLLGTLILAAVYIGAMPAPSWRLVLLVSAGLITFVVLMAIWAIVLAGAISMVLLLDAGYNTLARGVPFLLPWDPPRPPFLSPLIQLLAMIGIVATLRVMMLGRRLGRRVLFNYDLNEALLESATLRQFLIRIFDPDLYKPANSDKTIDQALRDDNAPHDSELKAKIVGDYAYVGNPSDRVYTPKVPKPDQEPKLPKPPPPIHVAVAVVDLETGDLTTVPPYTHVVTALEAALAKPPFFKPVNVFGRYVVDATAQAHEPTAALLQLLNTPGVLNPAAAAVHLYSVAPVPFGRLSLGPEFEPYGQPHRYTRLLDVLRRVFQLRRFRDATLERRLTELHTRAMPQDGTVFFNAGNRNLLRVWVYPIEPEEPLAATYLALQANDEAKRRQTVAEAVADGCRATLQMMMQDAIDAEAQEAIPGQGKVIWCRKAVSRHLTNQNLSVMDLPGSAPVADSSGPGIAEVCEHCALYRVRSTTSSSSKRPPERPRSLIAHTQRTKAPAWPAHDGAERDWMDPPHVHTPSAKPAASKWKNVWPVPQPDVTLEDRSTVSLLFSGGVFRGVFQIGVLNAISEASLCPDVVAGASVGSITSAMAARAFVTPGARGRAPLPTRQAFIRRLAATYLVIDRLLLTDRFADFVRSFTVRAAQARFSLREADRVIRRFDAANPWTWSSELRRVVAGFERLAYVSPFELRDVVEAFRRQQVGLGLSLLERYFQELLERAGIGQEVLGSEPLQQLITDYVLKDLTPAGGHAAQVTFQEFLDSGIAFFATATNLTEGRLDAWGDDQLSAAPTSRNLLQALLTSSAFPGVFRRRWGWESHATTAYQEEYADGGVMDNLPLDAVARFLDGAATGGLIGRNPKVPHLIFSASLQTNPRRISDAQVMKELSQNWMQLRLRNNEIAYNRKLELFARTQENLRDIVCARGGPRALDPSRDWIPLDLQVLTIVPRWLCGTLAFHPMLGFRRCTEAQSIAHGCASTLLKLGGEVHGPTGGGKTEAWRMDGNALPSSEQSLARDPFIPLKRVKKHSGHCWYRPGVVCPFSFAGQDATRLDKNRTEKELNEIYVECGRIRTHRPR